MADRIHYNGQDKWKQKATDVINSIEGGGGGNVDDVKVNGTSVVDANKIAQIDLTDYATHTDVTNDIEDALDEYTDWVEGNYYTKTEVNTRLSDKADASTTYTKTEVDTALQSKANANGVYTKTEADTLLSAKANASDVYTKSETYSDDEVDALLSDKADTADLATVATSGSYTDLSDKPTIPDELADLQSDSTHRTVTDAEKTAWNNKQDTLTAGEGIDITSDVISLEYLTVVNGKVCIVYDDGQ